MKTVLKIALGGTALILALLGGAALLPATASAGERNSYLGDGAPATLEQVRRRIWVGPAYGYDDPYDYDGDAYYPPAAYAPPVAYGYVPPPAYAYVPPPAYGYVPPVGYGYGPGPGVAVVGPRGGVYVGTSPRRTASWFETPPSAAPHHEEGVETGWPLWRYG